MKRSERDTEKLLSFSGPDPVLLPRYMDLEPDARARDTRLRNGEAGDLQDLLCKEETESRVLPEPALEDLLFCFDWHAHAIVFVDEGDATR